MFTYAIDQELVESHPLVHFSMLPEKQKALRVMTIEEERRLVECVAKVNPVIGAYVAILGETGLRKSEGLRLEWRHIDLGERMLSVENTKSGRVRYIPLTEYAIRWLNTLTRGVGIPWVFLKVDLTPWKDMRDPFYKGRNAAGMDWVKGFHDLRHHSCNAGISCGVDIRVVQELLGHSDIQTTMRYAHYAPNHAIRSVHQAEKIELERLDRYQNVTNA